MDHRRDLRSPGGIAPRFRHDLPVAQSVEEIEDVGAVAEKYGIEAGQVRKRRVEHRERAASVEGGKAGRQVGEGPGEGLDEFTLRLFGTHAGGDVVGIDDLPLFMLHIGDVIPARRVIERHAARLRRGKKAVRIRFGNDLCGPVLPQNPA
jgi:hypothetical protein